MIRLSTSGIFKFLTGILLVQIAAGILILAALRTDNREVWALFLLLDLSFCLLTALWFASMLSHAKRDARAQMQEDFSREREKIRVEAEREKSRLIQKNHQRIIKDRNRTQTKEYIKSGTLLAGVLLLGGIMAFTQFFTVGLLLMATAGGLLGGYLFRSRQIRLTRQQTPASDTEKLVDQSGQRMRGGSAQWRIKKFNT